MLQYADTMTGTSSSIFDAKQALSQDQPAISLGQVFSPSESCALANLNTNSLAAYDNYGDLECFETELCRFFIEQGNDDAQAAAAASPVNRFVRKCLSGLKSESAWVKMHSFTPIDIFDTPRWHRDGYFYKPCEEEKQHKVVLTLKGAGTLFNFMDLQAQAAFSKVQHIPHDCSEWKKMIADGAIDQTHVVQANLQEAYIFVAGADYAAIHSEPPIHNDRFFLSIVPGKRTQIDELRAMWQQNRTTYSLS